MNKPLNINNFQQKSEYQIFYSIIEEYYSSFKRNYKITTNKIEYDTSNRKIAANYAEEDAKLYNLFLSKASRKYPEILGSFYYLGISSNLDVIYTSDFNFI